MPNLRIALAQINATVGALSHNTKKIAERISESRKLGANIAVFPELAICGYPPEDLLLKPAFIRACREHLNQIASASENMVVIVGFPERQKNDLFNAAAVICNKKLVATYRKHDLPNYGVFDEERYFTPGAEDLILTLGRSRLAVNICEDIWTEDGIYEEQARAGHAQLLINISASPYHHGSRC